MPTARSPRTIGATAIARVPSRLALSAPSGYSDDDCRSGVRSVRRSVGEEGEAVFTRITAERVYDLAGARSRFARAVRLSMNGEASSAGAASSVKLKTLLEPYRQGQCAVEVRYRNGGASVEMQLGDNWRVSLDDALMQSLNEWLKPENVEVVYP